MTLFSRLVGKAATPPASPGSVPGANVPSSGNTASQRDTGVATMEFGEELLQAAFSREGGPDQRTAQKRLAELIDSSAVMPSQLPAGDDSRESVLATLALCSDLAPFERAASELTDQDAWLRLATGGSSAKLRQLAAQRIEGEERLRAVIKAARESDKNVYRIAKTKLDDIHAAQKKAEEARAHILSVGETIERHSYKPFDGAFVATLEHLVGEWQASSIDVPEETRQRVTAAIERARESITNHIRAAGAQAARESAIANAGPIRDGAVVDLQKMLAALYVAPTLDPAAIASVSERLAKLRERWRNTLEYKPAGAQEQTQFDRLNAAVQRLSARSGDHGTLQQQLDAAAATPSDDAYARITKMIADADLIAEQDSLPLIAQARDAAAAWRDRLARERASVADTERQLTQLIRRAQQALASGQSRQALGIRRSIEPKLAHLPHAPKHLLERLQQLDDKLKELQDWKSFAVTPKRGELIAEMQSLIGIEEDPAQLAERIKQLQEEWKSLAKGSTDTEDDWTKFHEASQAAYEPCRKFFEAQSKAREGNLQKRKALVARLNDYETATDWEHVEWKYVANAVRSAKQEWRDSGPTDRAATKPLEKAFDALIDKIQARLDAEYSANLEQKRSLVAQAQRLASVTDLAQASNDVKRLQSAWRDIGLTPHAEGQRLWDEFKQLCDAVFDKRRQQHSERITELKQVESQAATLCAEAESLAQLQGAEVLSGAARMRELRDAFAALGELPRDSAHNIQRRFRRAIDQFDQAVVRHRQREVDEAWDNLFAAANRVRLQQLEASDAAELRNFLDSIKQWPKGGAQAIERRVAQSSSAPPASALAENEAALRVLAIRAEIATEQPTPASDQTQRRMMQLQALVNGTGRTTSSKREQLEALAFEWVAIGPTSTSVYEALFARFQHAWQVSRR